jgi:hypothetical protein
MIQKRILIPLCILIFVCACSNKGIIGEKIELPSDMEIFKSDSITDYQIMGADSLVLAYFRADCPSCFLNIEKLINIATKTANDRLVFLIILGADDKFELFRWCVANNKINISYPVMLDINDCFLSINNKIDPYKDDVMILDKHLIIKSIIK